MSVTSVVASSISSSYDPSESWYDPTPEEEEAEARLLRSAAREHPESHEMSSTERKTEEANQREPNSEMSTLYKASNGRQIAIDILDSANVKKYEKLVQSDQIKSPFKRRLSGESSGSSEDAYERDAMDSDHVGAKDQHQHEEPRGQWKKAKKHENDHGNDRLRRESSSSGTSSQNSRKQTEYETDEAVLARRQKQIDYGKNTLGYENYIQQVPKHARTNEHPRTPQKYMKYSRRAWDGLVKVWRKQLHCFDPNSKFDDNI
uniref:Histone RNA hairpin-binding protein RNA-binding domain-containing protein n=1 Tax=Anopheles dirus TaxID=7168 RepID=A0A182NZ93_9DIPT